MKKKASLWISGITTVAMLAVAVGSFAAWDQLSGNVGNALTVNTSTPVVLEVGQAEKEATVKTLLPSTAEIVDENTESKEPVKVGHFTAQLTGTSSNKKVKTTVASKAKIGGTETNDYKVTLKEVNSDSSTETDVTGDTLTLKETATTYNVYIQRTDSKSFDTVAEAKAYTTEKIDIDITLTATEDNAGA